MILVTVKVSAILVQKLIYFKYGDISNVFKAHYMGTLNLLIHIAPIKKTIWRTHSIPVTNVLPVVCVFKVVT